MKCESGATEGARSVREQTGRCCFGSTATLRSQKFAHTCTHLPNVYTVLSLSACVLGGYLCRVEGGSSAGICCLGLCFHHALLLDPCDLFLLFSSGDLFRGYHTSLGSFRVFALLLLGCLLVKGVGVCASGQVSRIESNHHSLLLALFARDF